MSGGRDLGDRRLIGTRGPRFPLAIERAEPASKVLSSSLVVNINSGRPEELVKTAMMCLAKQPSSRTSAKNVSMLILPFSLG